VGFILLVAIVAAISLVFHGRKQGVKSQNIAQQHQVRKSDRLRLIPSKEPRA
jgi:NADH-quinone oxidoreductase subunit J